MAVTGDIRDQRSDFRATHHNRRRARAIASLPSVVVFGIVALVLAGLGAPVVGLVAGAAAAVALYSALLLGATSLLVRSLGARRADEEDLPRAYNIAEGLCASMGLPVPKICEVDDQARNALTLGRGPHTAVLIVTTGLVEALDPVALEGVLAHELNHVKRADIAPSTVSAAVLLPIAVLGQGAASAVHRLAGRGREFLADQLAIGVTRYPPGLREALSDIVSGPPPRRSSGVVGKAAARATRWLWTVAASEDGWEGSAQSRRGVQDLDAVTVRIAALEEW